MKQKGTKNLTYTQRLMLEDCLKAGLHKKVIAEKLGVCLATIYNEIKRGECVQKKYSYTDWLGDKHYKHITTYSPNIAEEKYRYNMSAHGAPLKIGNDYEFVHYVEKRVLQDKLSPCAVLGEINRKKLFSTKISKTTMYRYIATGIFMNMRMQDLPMYRKTKRYRKTVAKRLPKGTSIEKRPLEVLRRQSFGNWEMDCVCGKQSTKDTLLVLTERITRFEIIRKIPNRKADTVIGCINNMEKEYGEQFSKIFHTITVDNGSEFADFAGLERSIYTGKRTNIFYCHPYTSCERGTNERINRDIRRLLPKGTDFSSYSDRQIQSVENWVNAYPREMFGYATSAERFAEELLQLQN